MSNHAHPTPRRYRSYRGDGTGHVWCRKMERQYRRFVRVWNRPQGTQKLAGDAEGVRMGFDAPPTFLGHPRGLLA